MEPSLPPPALFIGTNLKQNKSVINAAGCHGRREAMVVVCLEVKGTMPTTPTRLGWLRGRCSRSSPAGSASQRLTPRNDSGCSPAVAPAQLLGGDQLSQRRRDWKNKTSPEGRAAPSEFQWSFLSFEGRLCWEVTERTSQSCWFLAKTKTNQNKLYREKKNGLKLQRIPAKLLRFLAPLFIFLILYRDRFSTAVLWFLWDLLFTANWSVRFHGNAKTRLFSWLARASFL